MTSAVKAEISCVYDGFGKPFTCDVKGMDQSMWRFVTAAVSPDGFLRTLSLTKKITFTAPPDAFTVKRISKVFETFQSWTTESLLKYLSNKEASGKSQLPKIR